jgi:hypothetical protein
VHKDCRAMNGWMDGQTDRQTVDRLFNNSYFYFYSTDSCLLDLEFLLQRNTLRPSLLLLMASPMMFLMKVIGS